MDYLCPIVDPAKNKNMDYLCPDTSQNRKRWQLCLMDKFVIYGINFYSCTRYKLLCDYNSSSSSDTGLFYTSHQFIIYTWKGEKGTMSRKSLLYRYDLRYYQCHEFKVLLYFDPVGLCEYVCVAESFLFVFVSLYLLPETLFLWGLHVDSLESIAKLL